ncbi:transglutaminaseTgpA domain-containing protein [Amycolatopsis cihanbeyliensis]|uniref:Transglutaminase superfamily protein n=1 Tax=Amycolatopsis cihanbeyliensis TaxID=1128664 RepID=A0A542CT34_AMYCI|nr:DUF3488 and transglutaminase-like domain-containing protein [Amycolatopsis cihanbeyliensis]TQI93998.1 transglutaminase superfamily protein [Amycolatopsis cihanbeyliensis]
MTAAPPGQAQPHQVQPQRPSRQPAAWGGTVLAPVAAGLATICAATSLTGVVAGWAWLGYVIVATVLVACTGLALRTLRTPTLLVGLAQLAVLLFLVVGVFTRSGTLAILPGPTALAELNDVLVASFEQVRTGLPPVEAGPPILCLVTIAIGLVAILVDTLAIAASAPAASGLILLCVYAVPASLSNELLPWWTFALGAGAFAGLLAVDGSHRHRRWRNRDGPSLGGSPSAATAPVAVVCVALLVGLVAGSGVTAIGTAGRLPGAGSGDQTAVSGGLGVNPFTSLRGMLDQGANVELFRVRGLGDDQRLLRAFTLNTYRPNEGWGLPEAMPAGVPANGPLPAAPGDNGTAQSREIQIDPVNWVDVWLPVYGAPRNLANISDGWFYDQTSGSVFRERRQAPGPYVEMASLTEPSREELRAARSNPSELPPIYTEAGQVDPRVMALAEQLTRNEPTTFDKAAALWRYFTTAENGFTYDTRTAEASDSDALADFLLNGKRGFCEQFASAMAVMLRALDIPARVAVGFTTGYPASDYRSITSQDAHAWVEVYFGASGWVSFDPTPLADGRGYLPPYLQRNDTPSDSSGDTGAEEPSPSASPEPSAGAETEQNAVPLPPGEAQPNFLERPPAWSGWGALIAGLAALVLTVATVLLGRRSSALRHRSGGVPDWLSATVGLLWVVSLVLAGWQVHWTFALGLLIIVLLGLAPSVAREVTRRRRLRTIATSRSTAADAAWDELLDECADRGTTIPKSDTVRVAAQKLAHRHHLDEEGKDHLRTVVGVVERSWYSPTDREGDPEFASAFHGLRQSLRRSAPVSLRGRLLPRSLFRRRG